MQKNLTVLSIGVMMMLFSNNSFARDFDLDRGIGFEKGRDVESWMESRQTSSADSLGNTNRNSSSSIGTAIGNMISIRTEHNSHVVLNATQINRGNQTVEINMNNKQYKNVEEPTYKPDGILYYNQ